MGGNYAGRSLISARLRPSLSQKIEISPADVETNLFHCHTVNLPPRSAALSLFLFSLLISRLTQLFHSASGVGPLILAWRGGNDADGSLLVNLICKSKLCLCFSAARPPPPSHFVLFSSLYLTLHKRRVTVFLEAIVSRC